MDLVVDKEPLPVKLFDTEGSEELHSASCQSSVKMKPFPALNQNSSWKKSIRTTANTTTTTTTTTSITILFLSAMIIMFKSTHSGLVHGLQHIRAYSSRCSSRCHVPGRIPERIPSLSSGRIIHSRDIRAASTNTMRLYSSSTGTNAAGDDSSAISKARLAFSSPKGSADDSAVNHQENDKNQPSLAWNQLGLWTELVEVLTKDFKFKSPTQVQQLVIPELLKLQNNTAFLAATGSGKTLAYVLPLLQYIKEQEVFHESETPRPKRPKLLILVPTRELAVQIISVTKALCRSMKLSSAMVIGGEDYGRQRKYQLDKPLDVLVATPGRLYKHWKEQNVFLGSLRAVVLDEMDTMLEQGFAKELRSLLYPILYHKQEAQTIDLKADWDPETAPKIILTSATMTQAVQKVIGDTDGSIRARKHHQKSDADDPITSTGKPKMILPPCEVLKAKGLHKAVPRLKQVFVDVGSTDKMSLLSDILSSGGSGAAIAQSDKAAQALTIIFCNTASSCRAVQYALGEAKIETIAYHGELNSSMRSENLQIFRNAGQGNDASLPRVLVCTDLAARGLDVPQVEHVVMFDFPLNALDYLHRSGRTARGEEKGRVTALVSRRDKVLANAIERAVLKGEPLDGLTSRKSDYIPGGRLHATSQRKGRAAQGTRGKGKPKMSEEKKARMKRKK